MKAIAPDGYIRVVVERVANGNVRVTTTQKRIGKKFTVVSGSILPGDVANESQQQLIDIDAMVAVLTGTAI